MSKLLSSVVAVEFIVPKYYAYMIYVSKSDGKSYVSVGDWNSDIHAAHTIGMRVGGLIARKEHSQLVDKDKRRYLQHVYVLGSVDRSNILVPLNAASTRQHSMMVIVAPDTPAGKFGLETYHEEIVGYAHSPEDTEMLNVTRRSGPPSWL